MTIPARPGTAWRGARSPPHLGTLVLTTALSVLSLNMFLPSLSAIAGSFGADYALISLSLAGYLGVTALLQLLIGPLSDRYGRRPVLLAALALFVPASLGCALADDVHGFLAFRVLQGGVIAGWVVAMASIRDTAPEQQAASLIGYVSMAMAIAPMLGPMLGGTLDALFGWRANFFAYALFGTAVFVLCWFDLGETNGSRAATFGRQFRSYPELLAAPRFWGFALCAAFSTGAFYAFLAGAPLVATTLFAMSPATLGLAIGSITGGFMVGSFLSGRYARHFALTTTIIAGRLLACAGPGAGLLLFLAGYGDALTLFGSTVLVGLGNGLTMPGSNAGAMSVRPRLAGSAAGLAGALTVGGGALITSAVGVLLGVHPSVYALLGSMLLCSALGLAAILAVRRIDRRDAARR